eukprot:1154239-Pelagomonas_calceolata.AAC.4
MLPNVACTAFLGPSSHHSLPHCGEAVSAVLSVARLPLPDPWPSQEACAWRASLPALLCLLLKLLLLSPTLGHCTLTTLNCCRKPVPGAPRSVPSSASAASNKKRARFKSPAPLNYTRPKPQQPDHAASRGKCRQGWRMHSRHACGLTTNKNIPGQQSNVWSEHLPGGLELAGWWLGREKGWPEQCMPFHLS